MDKYKELVLKGKEAYLDALNEIGWFKVSNNSKDEIEKRLNEENVPANYLFSLWDLWFDAEGFDSADGYEFLLNHILETVKIEIVKVSVSYVKETNSVEIEINTKSNNYHYSIELKSDWIDDDFINEFINNLVLVKENIDRKFFEIPTDDQTAKYVFLPQSVYDKAIKLGVIPNDLGYFHKQEERINTLHLQIDEYKQEIINDPEDDIAFYNVGYLLFELYLLIQDEKTMQESCTHFEKAISLNPNCYYAWDNWGVLLYNSARINNDKNLLKEGIEKCRRAYMINDACSYNLACGYALINDKANALLYLSKSLKNNVISVDNVKNDEDWKNYLSDKDFINIFND